MDVEGCHVFYIHSHFLLDWWWAGPWSFPGEKLRLLLLTGGWSRLLGERPRLPVAGSEPLLKRERGKTASLHHLKKGYKFLLKFFCLKVAQFLTKSLTVHGICISKQNPAYGCGFLSGPDL